MPPQSTPDPALRAAWRKRRKLLRGSGSDAEESDNAVETRACTWFHSGNALDSIRRPFDVSRYVERRPWRSDRTIRPSRSKTFRFRVRVERSTPRALASSVIESDRSKATAANVENCEISKPSGSRAALYRRATKFAVFRACSAKQRSPIVLIWLRRRSPNSSSMRVMCIYTMMLSSMPLAAGSTRGPLHPGGAGSSPGRRPVTGVARRCAITPRR